LGEDPTRNALLAKNHAIFRAGLLREWVIDGYRLSWILATGFTDNMLF